MAGPPGRCAPRVGPWGGDAWSTQVQLSPASGIAQQPTLGLDAGGNVIAVWKTGATQLYWAGYTSGGGWSASPTLLPTGFAGVDAPAFAMNTGGTGVLTWRQNDGTNWRIAALPYASATLWGTPNYIQVSTGGDAQAPAASLSASGQAVVVWSQPGTDGRSHIYANRYTQ